MEKEKQKRRGLEELNLIDDFLFQEILSRGEAGEEVCRILLSTILGRSIGRVKVTAQKMLLGMDTSLRGIRMDAYVESVEDMDMEVEPELFDVEPNNTYEKDALPWRTRLYQAIIDAKQLETGWDYQDLKNVYIIMILPYDPFGKNRMVYTFKNRCVEDPQTSYEDGVRKIYLYTKGAKENASQELCDMLKYIENSIAENVTNESIRAIHKHVNTVKQDKEVGVQYMKSWERDIWLRREGKKEGKQEERQLINTLIIKLAEDGRTDDIVKSASDEAYQEALLKEYSLLEDEEIQLT